MMDLINLALAPLNSLADISSRASLLYFLSYIIFAYFIFKSQRVKQEFVDFLFPDHIYASRGFLKDIAYFCLIMIFATFLSRLMPVPVNPVSSSILYSLLNLLIFDFIMFGTHFLQHKIPVLWKCHQFHHQPDDLNFLTAFRHHPIDVILVTGAFAISNYALSWFAPFSLGNNVFILIFYFAGYHLRHSHIPLEYPRWLPLISPSDHQRHHNKSVEFHDKNFGFIFSFWDRAVRSYYFSRALSSPRAA